MSHKVQDESQRQRFCSKCGEGGHRAKTCKGPGNNRAPESLRASSLVEIPGYVRLSDAAARADVDLATVRLWAGRAQASLELAASGNTRGAVFIKEAWLTDWIEKRRVVKEAEEAAATAGARPATPRNGEAEVPLSGAVRSAIAAAVDARSLNLPSVRAKMMVELREELREELRAIVREELDALTAPGKS